MRENRNIEIAANAHEQKGGGRNAFSFGCGAEWALEKVGELLNGINLNEFIIGKISYNGFGVKDMKLEFTDDFCGLLRIAIAEGLDVRNLSPAERTELLKRY